MDINLAQVPGSVRQLECPHPWMRFGGLAEALISIDAKRTRHSRLVLLLIGILEKEVNSALPVRQKYVREDIMSQTLEQFQAIRPNSNNYDQAIALLYWDLPFTAPKNSIEAKLSAVGYFFTIASAFRRRTNTCGSL